MKITRLGEKRYRLFWELPRGADGQRRQKTQVFRGTKDKAEKRWREVQAEIDSGKGTDPEKLTMAELLARWQKDVLPVRRLRAKTLDSYAYLIDTHIIPRLGEIRIDKLTAAHLQRLYRTLLESGRVKGEGGLSSSTVVHVHNILNDALDQALRWGVLGRNVTDLVDPPPLTQREMTIWTPEEVSRFLSAIKEDRLYPLFYLVLLTGLRQGEVLGLQWADVDLQEKTLTVRRTITHLKGQLIENPPKTARGRRPLELGEAAAALLQNHRKNIDYPTEWVFSTRYGTPIHRRNVNRSLLRLQELADVPKIRFHDLRHSHASFLLATGANPRLIADRLGHSDVAFTLRTYAHLLPGAQREAAERVESLFHELPGDTKGTQSQKEGEPGT